MFGEAHSRMERYLEKYRHYTIVKTGDIRIGDTVIYLSAMYGWVPAIVSVLGEDRVSCSNIDDPGISSGWVKRQDIRRILLESVV